MLKSSLCGYSDAYKCEIGIITAAKVAAGAGNNTIEVDLKNWAPFTHCLNETNNTQTDNAKYIDVVMPMYDLIEYSVDHLKTFRSLW